MIYRTYELRSPSLVQAVQWQSEHPQDKAEEIVTWVNNHGNDIASYNSLIQGPKNAGVVDWGHLTLFTPSGLVEVDPEDYIVRDHLGRFFVVDPILFETVYHEVSDE